MKDINLIKEFCNFDTLFKNIEMKSESLTSVPSNQYLIVRLDGIGLSKKYLKDSMDNAEFKEVMTKAIEETYCVLHRKSKTKAKQIFLGVIMASDEVSFIFNTDDNFFDKRLFKIVTTLASTLSCFFTKNGAKYYMMGSFDGRPLVVDTLEQVNNYIAYRLSIYFRNTMAKMLRLNNVPTDELYSEQHNNNINYYQEKFLEKNLSLNNLNNHCGLFIPNLIDDKKLDLIHHSSIKKLLPTYKQKITFFESYLDKKNMG